MTETMPPGWTPRKRGRKPLIDALPILKKAQGSPEEWLCFSTYSDSEVKSLKRQLQNFGCDVSVSNTGDAPALYVKWSDDE